MHKKLSCTLLLICLAYTCFSQAHRQAKPFSLQLKVYEDSLKRLGKLIVNGKDETDRRAATYKFIPLLVKALKIEGSFEYPFDSVKHINIIYPDDKSFRIFNWNLLKTTGVYRYYGAIQKKSSELKIWPLYDYSDYFKHPTDTVTSSERWFGMLYYQIKQEGKYYLLFGWDGNTLLSNKKIIDVLSFDKKGNPVFGAKIFNIGTVTAPKYVSRFMIEYKENAQVSMRYDNDLQMIMYDHLIPIDEKAEGMYEFYVPDGSYEGFQYHKKKWNHVSSMFDQTQKEAPVPDPINFDKKNEIKKIQKKQ